MKKQDPEKRIANFEEVNQGYDDDEAIKEASRCIQCKKPVCIDGCPVSIDIPKFIQNIKDGEKQKAITTIKKSSNLPGVCGRVCPQESLCEKNCLLDKKNKGIKIGYLERYAADNEKETKIQKQEKKNLKIAVIGSGPSSLTCASDLAVMGYKVVIFEALHKPGGVLTYGIPDFRLPTKIVEKEIEAIKKIGVEIRLNKVIGNTFTLDELKKEFDAIFIGIGAGLPYFLNIPGEGLNNVLSANEFLVRVNLMKAHDKDFDTPVKKAEKTVVVGGGNVAIDAARVARRLGSDVTIVYRRSFAEMPARKEEIENAQEEGVHFLMLTNPVKITGKGKIEAVECVQMMLGDKDSSGRRKPVPIEGSNLTIPADQMIVSIGQGPNPLLLKNANLRHNEKGSILVDDNLMTSKQGVFAGGDIISGDATVIKAMGDGKKAATNIDRFLKGEI